MRIHGSRLVVNTHHITYLPWCYIKMREGTEERGTAAIMQCFIYLRIHVYMAGWNVTCMLFETHSVIGVFIVIGSTQCKNA